MDTTGKWRKRPATETDQTGDGNAEYRCQKTGIRYLMLNNADCVFSKRRIQEMRE